MSQIGNMADQREATPTDLTSTTIDFYDGHASAFWNGTKYHDVTQNYAALLDAIHSTPPFTLLDLGCGPGRDLAYFQGLGHIAIGLDGAPQLAEMARNYSGAEVWVQDFIDLDLPETHFDGVFANASLFHVPMDAIETTLAALWRGLRPAGVLFSSNPRGNDEQGFSGGRFGVFYRDETWMELVQHCGFEPVRQYFRPPNAPPHEQFWFATVWRKSDKPIK
jgi:SAM-dependent methyltransferase